MPYKKIYSAKIKTTVDCAVLLMATIILLAWSHMIWSGRIGDAAPEVVRIILSATTLLIALLLFYLFATQLPKIFTPRKNWLLELNKDYIRLLTPTHEETQPFEYEIKYLKKLSREAYNDDGVHYTWYLHLDKDGEEHKEEFDLGPFSAPRIAHKMHSMYNIRVVEVDSDGTSTNFHYNLLFELRRTIASALGMLIVLSFLIPSIRYLLAKSTSLF